YKELSKKGESYEICFVPDNDYRSFLRRRVPDLEESVAGGNFVNTEGKVIGTHVGYPFFTIGQRKGLGMAFGQPMFVTEIRPETNEVVLGTADELLRNGMRVYQPNSMKYETFPENIDVLTKVRYKDQGTMSQLRKVDDKIEVEFFANVAGVAPGQSAVFYEGDDVIGGGIIHSSLASRQALAFEKVTSGI
ncbi:MAG: tRNA methyl transferase PRC-barrel domain-containing protein, partial [Bacteroidota bacterium]